MEVMGEVYTLNSHFFSAAEIFGKTCGDRVEDGPESLEGGV